MLYTAQNVRDNIRNKDGKRVFYLGKGDSLTSEARDYLQRERSTVRWVAVISGKNRRI